jgi:purine-binding chemotaxis protein CheW
MQELRDNQTNSEGLLQLVSFNLADEVFGIDILKVREINRMVDITRVPNSPPYVEGIINLRGRVIPILDLRAKFGLPRKAVDKTTRIIVVEISGSIVGFIVDAVSEVFRILKNITEPPPDVVAGVDSEYITAVGKLEDRLLILLDLDKVFADCQTAETAA